MADIELVIKIPEEAKQAFDCAESNDLKGCYYDHGGVIGNAIKNGTPIPDNATNGDVIKAMFPDVEIRFFTTFSGIHTVDVDFEDNTLGRTYSVHTFNLDWWNTPYQKGGK